MIKMKKILFGIIIILTAINISISQDKSESDDFSYALKLFEENFYDLSAQQFIKFVNNHPGSSKLDEAGYYGAMSLFKLGDFNNARIEFQSVAVNYPKSKRAPESWYMCGISYEKIGNLREAAKAFETVKTLYATSSKAPIGALYAGNIYLVLDTFEKADQLFSLIQDRYIESEAYYPSLTSQGRLYLKIGKISKARDKFNKILQSEAGYDIKAQSNYLLGDLSEQQGYVKDAENYYTIVIETYSKSKEFINASLNLAKIKIQSGNYNKAIQILNVGLERELAEETKNEVTELLGDAQFLNKKFALAQKFYENSILNADGDEKNRRKLKNAISWYNQGNITNALSILEVQLTNLPDTLNNYLSMSLDLYFRWLEENKNYNKAINRLNEIKITPHFSDHFRKKLINMLSLNSNWFGIVRELEPIIKSNQQIPEIDDYVFNLAEAYENIEDYDKSIYYYNKILLEYPSSKYINETKLRIEYLNNFYLKNESMGVGQLALLIGELLKEENKSKLQFQLGKIYFHNLIDYTNAIQQFENALSLPENNDIKSDILYYIGKSYLNLSQLKENSYTQKNAYLIKSKEYFSRAMENIETSSIPDEVASELVKCGIKLDKPPEQKQINYYTTLLKKYPQSKLIENWHNRLADIYYTSSNLELAKYEYEILKNTFESSDKFPTYLFLAAKLKQLKNEEVLGDYRIIAGDYPDSEKAAEALFYMAEIYYNNAQFKEASQLYNKLISDYYYTDFAISASHYLADTYISLHQYGKAIKYFTNELSKIPLNDEVLRNQITSDLKINTVFKLGKIFYKINDWQKARINLSSYIKLSGDNLFINEAFLLLGESYYNLNDIESAIGSYAKIDKNDINNYKIALFKIGNCQFELKRYDAAAEKFGILLKIEENQDIFSKFIISQIRAGKLNPANKSIKLFSNKYSKQKNYLAAFEFETGEYLRINKNYNDAIKRFQNVKNNFKNTDYIDNAAYHEALVYITLNKQQEALDILSNFSKIYRNSDKLGAVFNTLGGIYFRSEKYESAILSFKNALEHHVKKELHQQILSNLIKTYTYVSFWDAALALSRDYINEYPDADDIIDKKITISQAYVNLNQFDRAVELLRQARTEANSEKEPEIQFYIGDAYLRAGQYENAIAEFVKIPLLSRKTKLQWEASALYYSGQAYEKLGKINEAIRMYEEIVKRPGIDLILKKDAKKRIEQIKS
jgi:tetratricopeptide (TPR) repeat protein